MKRIDKESLSQDLIFSKKKWILTKTHGYEIAVVSESTRGEWLGFTGTIFSLIVTGIGILTGKYKQNILDDYESFENSIHFHEIKTLAHKCTRK